MAETIYTIPINEAFEKAMEEGVCECPFCKLYKKLETNEIELILGASMMEPDVRIKTNELGFCREHYKMMLGQRRMLGIGLILESHLNELYDGLSSKGIFGSGADKAEKRLKKLNSSCYICGRIESNFKRMLSNSLYMWEKDGDFVKKFRSQKMFCLEHTLRLLESGREELPSKKYRNFFDDIFGVVMPYMKELCGDVSWFCKKFDYRYDAEPWGNSKDAVERAIRFLDGE